MVPQRQVRRPPRCAALAALLAIALWTPSASGQLLAPPSPEAAEAAAREHFEAGRLAFEAGDFVAAGRHFLGAYVAKPHHASLWNAARSFQRAGDLALAANLYQSYLREAPEGAADRDAAIAALGALEPQLGRLSIVTRGVTDVKVDGRIHADALVWVVPGAHVIAGRAPSGELQVTAEVAAGGVVSVVLAPAPTAQPPPPAPAPTMPPVRIAEPPREAPDTSGWPAWSLVPFAGATALAAGALIASGVDTENLRDEFDASGETSSYALDNGVFAMHRTNVLIAITAGLGAVSLGVSLFAIDWNGDAPGGRVVGAAGPLGASLRGAL